MRANSLASALRWMCPLNRGAPVCAARAVQPAARRSTVLQREEFLRPLSEVCQFDAQIFCHRCSSFRGRGPVSFAAAMHPIAVWAAGSMSGLLPILDQLFCAQCALFVDPSEKRKLQAHCIQVGFGFLFPGGLQIPPHIPKTYSVRIRSTSQIINKIKKSTVYTHTNFRDTFSHTYGFSLLPCKCSSSATNPAGCWDASGNDQRCRGLVFTACMITTAETRHQNLIYTECEKN